jgi:redox-sensitive bicupin YhaK (pirin superfamily)
MANRKIVKQYRPQGEPGFLGAGHIARPVITGGFEKSDPFIMLMDDWLDKKDNIPVGGPHPHAGFETVPLLLEGELGDGEHSMRSGDFEMMTAGSGIVHTETIDKKQRMRLLQLWLNLPKKDRWVTPRVQNLPFEHVPHKNEKGLAVKLYSGHFAGLSSPVQNYSPLIIADINMEAGTSTVQQLPANFNSFLYVISGDLGVGDQEQSLQEDEVGWLDLSVDDVPSDLILRAGKNGVRFILYAGKPTGDQIVSHGPFIAGSSGDIQRLYNEYRQGKMEHISEVTEAQRILY